MHVFLPDQPNVQHNFEVRREGAESKPSELFLHTNEGLFPPQRCYLHVERLPRGAGHREAKNAVTKIQVSEIC